MYQLRNFAEIFGIIKNNYVRHVEDKKLLRNAMGEILSILNPHSTYLDFKDLERLYDGSSG